MPVSEILAVVNEHFDDQAVENHVVLAHPASRTTISLERSPCCVVLNTRHSQPEPQAPAPAPAEGRGFQSATGLGEVAATFES